ncbi:pilus assembly protein TadG-related protein [Neomoorella thermoacetica]|uniref:pilus assembly protein TadG-related protein n=1 Tax=Neomoorella thermoacetica TaxID=1525 RepID=UPI0009BEF2AB|nr:pilus assembly protein TadG-related protein [Moorella thermoacetica]
MRLSAGGISRRCTSDESGAIFILTAAVVVMLTLLFAGVAEFGRALIIREQTQTASDAAALAAATSGVHRWVKIDVVTDRGQEEHCSKDTCWCSSCGTVTISGIVGDERRLIDEGGWRDFCAPPCSCGGGSCWFNVDDRWVTYDITSGVWGTDPAQIAKVENDMTEAVRQALAWAAYPYQDSVARVLAGRDLYSMNAVINDWSSWWYAWREANWLCQESCDYCRWDERYHEGACTECERCQHEASYAFDKLSRKRGWVQQVIGQIEAIKRANQQGGLPSMDMFADDAAHAFYAANTPPMGKLSWIWKLVVHESRNDPYYPSVTVYGRTLFNGLFARLFNVFQDQYSVDACGQGGTFYRDPKSQTGDYTGPVNDVGKWTKAPPDACWKD